ncbi:cardiolipin synthase [Isachenkonia alkalipeptolytica]|uniref:Cardiolipin synthase n=1 Tax=Isachenkonia alkalipeptolytica TaxID=2565777 RepID=A0AA43XKP4_9CLOT|nr:cardiolipin synthase [Isachenkonia alkalipeptolytica]NBG88417.1 cardiolipin synthase [Isachenkonia alkalipeptolytica]
MYRVIKGIKKVMFHRVAYLLVAFLLQIALIIGVLLGFQAYFVVFYGFSILLSIAVVIWVINKNIHPEYKLVWVIPILLFPIFGGLFYLMMAQNRISRNARRKMGHLMEKSGEVLPKNMEIPKKMDETNRDAANQIRYINDFGLYPPYKKTQTYYLETGERKFEKLIEKLHEAEKFIFLEYFIIAEGKLWNKILDILKQKVKEGVDVRVIYDDVGCMLTLPKNYHLTLEAMGIKTCVFNPVIPVLSSLHNNRDHRKIAVIDGKVAFTGGINIGDEYINVYEKHGHWKDSSVMIQGEGVWSFTVMFLSLWDYLRDEVEGFLPFKNKYSKEELQKLEKEPGVVQPFFDSPLDGETVGENVYLNLITKAKKTICITTPYLILDHGMLTAITSAAKSGVDVRIITPHIPDKWYVHKVTRSYYGMLINSGVKIYEYTPGFIHSKTFIVDDEYGVVGTINMDYRSLYLHFECGVWMHEASSLEAMKADFFETLGKCHQVEFREVSGASWPRVLGRSVLRLFSPWM